MMFQTADERNRLRVQQLGELANAYREKGKYNRAEQLFRRALAIAKRAFAADDRVVLELLNDLGVTQKYQGRYDEAEQCYRRALLIAQAR